MQAERGATPIIALASGICILVTVHKPLRVTSTWHTMRICQICMVPACHHHMACCTDMSGGMGCSQENLAAVMIFLHNVLSPFNGVG